MLTQYCVGTVAESFLQTEQKGTTKPAVWYEIVSSKPCAQIVKAVKFVTVMSFIKSKSLFDKEVMHKNIYNMNASYHYKKNRYVVAIGISSLERQH